MRHLSRSTLVTLSAFFLCFAEMPAVGLAQETRPMTIEDVLGMKSVGGVAMSPNGEWVAYVVTTRDMEENGYDSDIWVVGADGGEPVHLTRGDASDRSPQWAPDGSWLGFLSDREEDSQLWGIDPSGGEAWQVTMHPTGVGAFRIAPNGSRVAFTARPEKGEDEEAFEKSRGRPMVADSAYASEWSLLWVAELEAGVAGEAVQTSPDGLFVTSMVWRPDSEGLAFGARPSAPLRYYPQGSVYIQDEIGGPARKVTEEMEGGEGPVAWEGPHGLIISGSDHALGTFNSQLWVVELSEDHPRSLTTGLDENAGFVAVTDRSIFVEASRRFGRYLYRISLPSGEGATAPEPVSDGNHFYSGFSASEDGSRVAFISQDPRTPPDVFVSSTIDFEPRRLTTVNPQADEFALGRTRVIQWPSRADGEEIEGILTLPVEYQEGDRVPLLLRIHGGPSGVSTATFHGDDGTYPTQVFAGMGYAVLQPNYRGSTGYGERFRGLNRGDISGKDWIDIDSGVDFLIEEGIADPDRLGIMGWSFGGHHTYWGITQTDRYKAASAGAGANDLISMFSQTDMPEFYHTYLGPSPWEDFDLYEERSAYRYVNNVTTPLLIQVGERDERVPAEQSIQFYEAVKGIAKAPVKLVQYPGQPHGVREPVLQRDLMQRNVEWFTRWIPVGR
jgi:dipeptidyl aminopeptidase/acylaminoacyl peptidase